MLISDIRAIVKKNCGRDYADFNNLIDGWVNDTAKQRLFMAFNLWFMDYSPTVATVDGTRNYPLPGTTSFKQAKDDGIAYRDSSGKETVLDVLNEQEAQKYWGNNDEGAPEAVVIKGDGTYDVWPLPDAVYNIDWECLVFPTDLSDANTSNIISLYFPDIYVVAGTYKGFEFLEEYERAEYWGGEDQPGKPKSKLSAAIDRIVQYNIERKIGKTALSFGPNAKSFHRNYRGYQ